MDSHSPVMFDETLNRLVRNKDEMITCRVCRRPLAMNPDIALGDILEDSLLCPKCASGEDYFIVGGWREELQELIQWEKDREKGC